MPHFYLRLAWLPTIFLTTLLLIIRAQPYDDRELRELLFPADCLAPCFMGIQPGVTTVEEAVKALEASKWVSAIDNGVVDRETGAIYWEWSADKPRWISTDSKGKIWVVAYVVETITIFSDIRLGETQLVLGQPEGELIDPSQDRSRRSALYLAYYNQKGLLLRNWQPCNVVEPLLRHVIVTFMVQSAAYNYPYRNQLRDVYRMCENGVVLQ